MSLLKRIESARPGNAPVGINGAQPPVIPGAPPATTPTAPTQAQRLMSQAPVRESFRDVKFRIQSRVISDLDPKLDLSNQVEVLDDPALDPELDVAERLPDRGLGHQPARGLRGRLTAGRARTGRNCRDPRPGRRGSPRPSALDPLEQ